MAAHESPVASDGLHSQLVPSTAAPRSQSKDPCTVEAGEYEDYQRNLRRFQDRLDTGPSFSRSQSAPDVCRDVFTSSDLAQIGGFRREFLRRGPPTRASHARTCAAAPSQAGSMLATASQAALATDIYDYMTSLVFFWGSSLQAYDAGDGGGLFDDRSTMELEQESLCQSGGFCQNRAIVKKASVFKACVATFKAFIGTGILFLPQAVSNAGWQAAVAMLSCSAILSTVGILLLGECHAALPQSYSDLAGSAFGEYGYALVSFQIALSQSLFCTSYFIFFEGCVQQIFSTAGLQVPPTWALLMAITAVCVPFSWIRRIGKMKTVNLVADLIILVVIIYVGIAAASRIGRDGIASSVVAWRPSRMLCFAGTAVYSFEGIGVVIPIRESMARPELFPFVVCPMMAIFVLLLAGFGLLGYFAWGSSVETVVLEELHGVGGIVCQAAYSLVCLFSFPIVLYPTFSIIEPILFKGMPPSSRRQILKNCLRTVVVFAIGCFANFAATDLSIFVSLVGSFCCIPLALVFPPLVHMRLVKTCFWPNLALALFGVTLIPFTLYIDIRYWGS